MWWRGGALLGMHYQFAPAVWGVWPTTRPHTFAATNAADNSAHAYSSLFPSSSQELQKLGGVSLRPYRNRHGGTDGISSYSVWGKAYQEKTVQTQQSKGVWNNPHRRMDIYIYSQSCKRWTWILSSGFSKVSCEYSLLQTMLSNPLIAMKGILVGWPQRLFACFIQLLTSWLILSNPYSTSQEGESKWACLVALDMVPNFICTGKMN